MDSTSFSGVFRAPFFQLPLERRVEIAMEQVFGIQKLRPLQAKVIRHVLRTATTSGGNGSRSSYGSSSNSVSSSSLPASSPPSTSSPCRFQIAVMATGAGKSLCYQLPAVVLGGTTVVVTPLVALMEDQVRSLQRKGVAAEMIASNKPPEHNRAVLDRLVGRAAPVTAAQPAGKRSNSSNNNTNSNRPIPISCLYCTPEQIRRPQFRSVLLEMHRNRRPSRNKDSINPYRLSILAVDEAHCISQWGHDFRPAFRDELQWLASNLMGVPVLACTATATPAVLKDIQVGLLLGNADNFERKGNEASTRGGGSGGCRILVGDLDRPNLFYRVAYVDALLPVAQAAASKERLRPASFDPGRDEPANRVDGQHSVGIGPHRAHLLTHLERMHAKLQQQGLPCAGIVYCRKREQTLDVAGWINEAFDHARQPPASDRRSEAASSSFPPPPPPNRTGDVFVRAVAYHGGMSAADRAVAQESWTKGESDVVVATSAFGTC
jgi:superfamily II DNA helicase RecQ